MADMPERHNGLIYNEFLPQLSTKRRTRRYLEIGVSQGRLMLDMPAQIAVGVDPSFDIVCNVAKAKRVTTLVQATSDEFFADKGLRATLGGPPDLSFLDGFHSFEFLLRDFYNTERFGTRHSLIAMHDCLPLDGKMINRSFDEVGREDSDFPFWWTGDVWKIIPILQEFRSDIRLVCVSSYPTGVVFATNLDPTSDTLQSRYFEIVDKYRMVTNDRESLASLYRSIDLVDPSVILRDLDFSLYFRS